MAPTIETPLPRSLGGDPPQQWLAAPSPVYLTGEESLRVTSLANVSGLTLTISGRILRPDNTISRIVFTHAPASTRAAASTIVGLSEGWLLGLTIRGTVGAPGFGQVWASIELGIGAGASFAVDQTLGYGFMTANTPFAWPVSVNMLPLDGPGNLRSISGTTPAAGAEIVETVPTGARWELLAFDALLTTAAAVANRLPQWFLDDGVNTYFQVANGVNQTNSALWNNILATVGAAQVSAPHQTQVVNAPIGVRLGPGHRIRTVTAGIQPADQWGPVRYLVREWMTGE